MSDISDISCRNCGQKPSRGVLLLLDEDGGAICTYCHSLLIAARDNPQFSSPLKDSSLPQISFAGLRNLCRETQRHTDALEVFVFSSDGRPLGYSSERLPPFDLSEMGDLISSVTSSYNGIFGLLGGVPGFVLIGKEECHCLVRFIPPGLILAVIIAPENHIDKMKTLLEPFIEKLDALQKHKLSADAT